MKHLFPRLSGASRAALIAAALAASPAAMAVQLEYNDFNEPRGLVFNGDAALMDLAGDDIVNLAGAGLSSSGSLFFAKPVRVNQFHTEFNVAFVDIGEANTDYCGFGKYGADGLVFTIQAEGANALGGLGESKGYVGIDRSVGVALDTFCNGPLDYPHRTSVQVLTNGLLAPVAIVGAPADLDNGRTWKVSISYYGSTLAISFQEIGSNTVTNLSTDIDLRAVLGTDRAWVGFTSSTGTEYESPLLMNWSFDNAAQNQ